MHFSHFIAAARAFVLAAAQTDDRNLALGIINQARAGQGIPPLAWDNNLAAYANYWAVQMATGAVGFEHASGQYRPQQGETLFERQSGRCDTEYDYPLQHAANGWLAEGAQWNGQPVNTGGEPWLHWCKSSSRFRSRASLNQWQLSACGLRPPRSAALERSAPRRRTKSSAFVASTPRGTCKSSPGGARASSSQFKLTLPTP